MDNIQKIAQFLGIAAKINNNQITVHLDSSLQTTVYRLAEEVLQYDSIYLTVQENTHLTIIVPAWKNSCVKKITCIAQPLSHVRLIFEQSQHPETLIICTGKVKTGAQLHISARIQNKDTQKCGIVIQQIHEGSNSKSSCDIKGVLHDQARWWCGNMIIIEPNAAQATAEQKTYALLLSDQARFGGAPALEVLNQEVQCKHGSAVGSINEEHRFYIMSRGISPLHAEKLIIDGFLA